MKKRLLSLAMAAAIAFSAFAGVASTQQAEVQAAEAVTNIPVTVVSDITNEVVNSASVGDEIKRGQITASTRDDFNKTYSFTLTKPAYVLVSVYSTVCYKGYNSSSTIKRTISYNQTESSVVRGTETADVWSGTSKTDYLILNAGTYYVHIAMATDSGEDVFGKYNISVNAQYLDYYAQNNTLQKATPVSTDKINKGLITASNRNSWYKFTLKSTQTVSISTWQDSAWSTDIKNVQKKAIATTLWNSRRQPVAFWNGSNKYTQSISKNNVTLSAGTYYLSFYGDQKYDYDAWNNSEDVNKDIKYELRTLDDTLTLISNGGEIGFKITTIKNPTGLKAANTAGRKAKVTFKKVAGAKGYEVQYSTDKKFQSGVKTVNTKSTTVNVKNLKKGKTYYVRVRAWKYDMDYNKLYSSWATKSVRIKK